LQLYFQQFAKPEAQGLVGIECELLAVNAETGAALPYSGSDGIEAILRDLAYEFGYEKLQESGRTIALRKGGTFISLEPGGQVELSAEPVKSVHAIRRQLDHFFFELKTIADFHGMITFLACGIQPFSRSGAIEWVPKKRYGVMARYLARRGRLAHDMMKRTAANQVALDYSSEQDAFEKMCLVMRLTSIASAMFSNSSISNGRPSGFVSERMHIWRFTDPSRCGLLIHSLCPEANFGAYLDYLLDLPMMFIVRGKRWIPMPARFNFRRFVKKGYSGFHAIEEDFELHLSTVFPEARFKQYLEIRGADGQRSHLITAVPAFWKGILYSDGARRGAQKLVKQFQEKDFLKLHGEIGRKGLRARIRGMQVLELARELVRLSEEGLAARPQFNDLEQDERIFLVPLREEILKRGITQAEQIVQFWRGAHGGSVCQLLDYLKI